MLETGNVRSCAAMTSNGDNRSLLRHALRILNISCSVVIKQGDVKVSDIGLVTGDAKVYSEQHRSLPRTFPCTFHKIMTSVNRFGSLRVIGRVTLK